MRWSTNDNRNIRGPFDSEWVASPSRGTWTPSFGITSTPAGNADTAEHRRIVGDDATAYPGRCPVKRATLEAPRA